MRLRDRLARLCAAPRLPLLLGLLAIVLTLPSLGFGLLADDWTHRAKLLGHPGLPPVERPLDDLFVFFDGSHAQYERGALLGDLPWWAPDGLKASFWRPLAALTHRIDYALWPDTPALMHAHSLLWFGLCVGLVALLYRRLGGSSSAAATTAGMAGLLFCFEDAHAMAASWIANRNGSMSVAFGTLALLAHHGWRARGWRPGLPLGALALAASLLSGELALAVAGYLLAYALFLDPSPSRLHRLGTLLPCAAVTLLWLARYVAGGHGTWGAQSYVDPLSTDFPLALAERIPLLLAAQWLQVPSDLWIAMPRAAQLAMTVLGLGTSAIVWLLARPALRERPHARFFCLGMVLSLPPVCASFPMDRLLLFCGLGAFGLLAVMVEQAGLLSDGLRLGHWTTRGVGVLLVIQRRLLAVDRVYYPDVGRSIRRLAVAPRDEPRIAVVPDHVVAPIGRREHVAVRSDELVPRAVPATLHVHHSGAGWQHERTREHERGDARPRPGTGHLVPPAATLPRGCSHPTASGPRAASPPSSRCVSLPPRGSPGAALAGER